MIIKRIQIFICFPVLFIILSNLSYAKNNKTPTNEIPMYGGISRTPYEKETDEKFIQSVLKEYGSKEVAFQKGFEFGWNYFYKGDYAAAMRRFNQCWLIDPDDSRIFNAFGMIAAERGNLKEAIDWYQKGADKGDPKAQFNLANSYFNGRGVKKNYKEAAKWFHLAAEQDLEWAQNMTGLCYEYGFGVPRNTVEANKWYEKADSNGATDEEKSQRHQIDKNIPPEGGMIKE